jgi:hypothetical protein
MRTYINLRSTLSNTSWILRGAAALLTAALTFTFTLALQPNTHAPASIPPIHQAAPAAHNPNMPMIGAGSAYDGGSYVTERPAERNPNVPVIGAGSAYDGGSYVTERPAERNPNVPVIGAGSAYDGQ